MLGWSFYSGEIHLEYAVTIGTRRSIVDYAFIIEGKPLLFLEAKPFDSELSEVESNQCISYGKVTDTRWVALSNGQSLMLFDTSRGIGKKQCLVSNIELEKLPEGLNELSLLHRDSLLSGEIEEVVDRLAKTRQAIENLRKNQKQLETKFIQSILSITGDIFKNRVETISTQLTQQAINLLSGKDEPQTGGTGEVSSPSESVNEILRRELSRYPNSEVLVAPSKIDGVEFLTKYNAWVFINIKGEPKYFSLYVGSPESKLLYFAEIERITEPLRTRDEIEIIQDQDIGTFEKGKQVIWLKPETLVKFKDPIPLIDKRRGPRGYRYTTIEKIINAKKYNDL